MTWRCMSTTWRLQRPGTRSEHFDICLTKREAALSAGAVLGMPDEAEAWVRAKLDVAEGRE